jgi:hypothetical protein
VISVTLIHSGSPLEDLSGAYAHDFAERMSESLVPAAVQKKQRAGGERRRGRTDAA